jgi:tRNA-specific 2-thiouridylase
MKVAVAMSGGVDSSVTAALLKQQGYEVFGLTMRLFPPSGEIKGSAVHDAAMVADHLAIQHHTADFEPAFSSLIISDFIDQYRYGQTPNPCVLCNRHIKFGLLLDKARELGAEMLATGHYVRKTTDSDGCCHLRKARNLPKDQSYFLYTLTRERLSRLLFPLGEIESKDEVRRLARGFKLPVAEKSDSQEVCFIPNDDYIAFLEKNGNLKDRAGEIVHLQGTVLGSHRGIHRYTIGQRRGLGIAWSEPLYVVALDATSNTVVVGEQQYVAALGLVAGDVSWVNLPPETEGGYTCKIRYRHQPVACHVRLTSEGFCEVVFDEPQKAVTPGQSLVIYQGDEVLGGGRILSSVA